MKTITQTYHIKAPLEKVWKCLVDPVEIEQWGGGPAEMDEKEGTEFKFWGGDIYGTNIEVIPHERLIQDWYSGKWPEPSRVTFNLTTEDHTTRVDLLHENVPTDETPDIAEGWESYFLGAIKKYLEHAE